MKDITKQVMEDDDYADDIEDMANFDWYFILKSNMRNKVVN